MMHAFESGWAFELVPTTDTQILALDRILEKL